MIKTKLKGRPLLLLSFLVVGVFLGSAIGAAVFVEVQGAALTATGPGTVVIEASYVIFKDAAGYTCAKNTTTQAIEFRDLISKVAMQKAIDSSSRGNVWIKTGTYDMTGPIYTSTTSITGDGNGTILKVTPALKNSVIKVTNAYYKADGKLAFPTALLNLNRPNGVTISNLQIDGNRAVRANGDVMRGVNFQDAINCQVRGVYAHDILAGQGIYMTNSQYCTVRDSWIYNVGDATLENYGSGIAFGEASPTKVSSSHILIDNVKITKCTMSAIDLEPANNVTITNCQFLGSTTWIGQFTPVITSFVRPGYGPNDNIMVSGNYVYGAYGEFITLTPSNYSIVSNNIITSTSSTATAIYITGSHDNKITGNIIKTMARSGIVGVNCNSMLVSDNTITDTTTSKTTYGIRLYANAGFTSSYNVVKGNQITGFNYAISETTGVSHIIVTANVIKSCNVGTFLVGTDILRTGNILNGAREM